MMLVYRGIRSDLIPFFSSIKQVRTRGNQPKHKNKGSYIKHALLNPHF
jgi:hypothetical protein